LARRSVVDPKRFKAPLSPDASYEELATQRKTQGPDEIVELSKGWRKAFPDARGTITRVVESGDSVVLEIVWEGTHRGDLEGPMGTTPATYKKVRVPAVQVVTFRGEKVAATRHYFD
jgi:predicted ester cyclase